ncbi:MAG: dockerin type I repeat-containing protein, partial [Clostridia bacterium]|nr:dockerin type I repeat-containing protein [Clostridia bacterium]
CSRCGETESEIIADFTLGDVDGDGKVNAKDLKLLKQLMAGTALIEDVVFANTDINNDGKITSRDVALLKGYLLGTYLYEDLIAAHGN